MQVPLFSSGNFKLLVASLVLLVIGYILLGQGPVYNHLSWSVAPIVLVFVYCILLPFAIIYRSKEESGNKKEKGV